MFSKGQGSLAFFLHIAALQMQPVSAKSFSFLNKEVLFLRGGVFISLDSPRLTEKATDHLPESLTALRIMMDGEGCFFWLTSWAQNLLNGRKLTVNILTELNYRFIKIKKETDELRSIRLNPSQQQCSLLYVQCVLPQLCQYFKRQVFWGKERSRDRPYDTDLKALCGQFWQLEMQL